MHKKVSKSAIRSGLTCCGPLMAQGYRFSPLGSSLLGFAPSGSSPFFSVVQMITRNATTGSSKSALFSSSGSSLPDMKQGKGTICFLARNR
jgi:hypothetical protein